MIGHLVLFVTAAPGDSGYGWTGGEAVRLYGLFNGLVQSAPLLGGWIADTFTGKRRAAVWGLWLQTVPLFVLASLGTLPTIVGSIYDVPVRQVILEADVPLARFLLDDAQSARLEQAVASHADSATARQALRATVTRTYGAMTLAFYVALSVFVIGYGLQVPALLAMVGEAYEGTSGKREGGYTLLFMAAMVGFIIGALISGAIASRMGWQQGLAAAVVMMVLAAITLPRTPTPDSKKQRTTGDPDALPAPRSPLRRAERRRLAASSVVCFAYFVFVAAFEQWGGSFSLYVQNTTNRVVAGFEIPTIWIHSAQALFVIIVGPIMLAVWRLLECQGWNLTPPTKMATGLLITTLAFLIMSITLSHEGGSIAAKTSILWPLAFYWVITFGQMAVIPIGQAFVSREAPRGRASTMMGMFMLFGGVGSWVSGQIGALAEPFGILSVYLGIAAGTALAAVGVLSLRKWLMGLLETPAR